MSGYIWAYFATFLVCMLGIFFWGYSTGNDHFAAVNPSGKAGWYRDIGGRQVPEILDEDLFFHNIGGSIDNARRADIVALGPSFVSYAFDEDVLRRGFDEEMGLRFFDMSFIGVRSGEFARRVAERWHLRPKLWIINADDQFVHFFSRRTEVSIGPHAEQIGAVERWRAAGWLKVAAINLRWRLEDLQAHLLNGGPAGGIYRNAVTGAVDLSSNPKYFADGNNFLKVTPDPACHTSEETIAIARSFLQSLGGRVILTLVPHSQYCPTQARELAAALGVEIFIPPPTIQFSMVDAGAHMDHKGAVAFSNYLVSAIHNSNTYREMMVSVSE
jgi:hypothetical protein